ncbi:MFS transporter [Cohnella caldifontis]|uniref:MFS transporter n=1 Tax=Cohnella caldifontis TaxID=3027471 RepID=UPI0023ED1B87|nr:MFS transporter [Cohnella sp. YIM B05605]
MKDKPGRQMTVLRALQFSTYATVVMIATYFPLYFYSLGFSKLQIGAIYSVGPVLSIVSNLLVGIVSDKTKSLRRMISLLYLGQILALALLLPVREFGIMSLVMAFFYLFQTPVTSMLDSLTLLAAEQMKRSFPSIRMFGSLGYAVCAVVFGYALKLWGSGLTIYLALGAVAVALVISLWVADFQATVRKFEFRGLWNVLRRRETVAFFVIVGVISVAHRINEGFLSVAMRDHGASDSVVGAASLASSVSEIPVFFLLARFGHRVKEFPLLALAGFMYVVRMSLLSVAVHPWSFVAIQTMHSVTFGIFYITALRCLQSMIPEEYRSSGQAAFAIVWTGIAGLIAGTLGGWLYDAFGLAWLFRAGAAFALVGCAGFLYFHFRRPAV